ncbi:MAG: 30S ribosomal protein S6e [Candidatus Methanomethylicota archaeon]|uniref:Small ribosomal subunit protein eS6 n=1 Tax=Thermoproteota archaeon TaxID=2056631 RepID=A0A497EVK1_9CREN|nr:MAG: 30S ribosomal protein S6e [Candidatus Verstraetearchaeota archaeon]
MPEFKIVISDPKTGKAKQVTISDPISYTLIGLKIGDVIDGSPLGFPGVKLKITGGSDKAGFPMLPYLPGGRKYRILLSGPPGFRPKEKGLRRRKTVRGNVITEDIVQINMIVVEGEVKFEESEEKEEQ